MKKIIIAALVFTLLLAGTYQLLLTSGTIHSTSVRMGMNALFGTSGPAADEELVGQRYRVPEGFSLALYADNLPKARFMRFTTSGDLLLSRPHKGDILLLRRDDNGDGKPDAVLTLLSGLSRPLGLDLWGEWLYVAESNRIGRIGFDQASGEVRGEYASVVDGLGDNGNHWSKTIRFGEDGWLYLAQGSTCNVCQESDPRRATMMRFRPDGSEETIIATGLRNSVGFDWAPWSGELYATDNGRDMLGDDFPPCELNRIEPGQFYGWPYFNGDNVPDPDFGEAYEPGGPAPTPPAHGFGAHNAPLGITFPDTTGWPGDYQRTALVALHGSWNRSEPDGYKVVSLHWTDQGIIERDFLTGFLFDGQISGRPVDVVQGPDGAVYISDDYAGAIYRVSPGQGSGALRADQAMPEVRRPDIQAPAWLESVDLAVMSERGEQLYMRYGCASCHEQGDNPRLLQGLSQRLGHQGVIEVLQAPQSPMPVFPLSETELRELAVFLLDGEQDGE